MTEKTLTVENLIGKIKSRGFWEVVIRPLKFEKERLKSLNDCKELVQQCTVRLRGWDYPHSHKIVSGNDWVENLTDWDIYKELWRMYLSGQLFHIFGCIEDWTEDYGRDRIFWSQKKYLECGYGLGIILTLYRFTEIYEFVLRLAQKNLFDDLLKVSITLNRMKDRRLVTLDIRRQLFNHYICQINKIPLSNTMTVDEIISKSNEYAVNDTLKVFERFNWFKAPKKVLKEEQDKFLKGLI